MLTLSDLELMRSYDPDGWEDRIPLPGDYITFEAWVYFNFGETAWDDYNSDWENQS